MNSTASNVTVIRGTIIPTDPKDGLLAISGVLQDMIEDIVAEIGDAHRNDEFVRAKNLQRLHRELVKSQVALVNALIANLDNSDLMRSLIASFNESTEDIVWELKKIAKLKRFLKIATQIVTTLEGIASKVAGA